MDRSDFRVSRMVLGREELEALPRTRKDAEIMGSLLYYTGEPCLNGHLSARYTSSSNCTLCVKHLNAKRKVRQAPKNAMTKIDDLKFQAELKALEGKYG